MSSVVRELAFPPAVTGPFLTTELFDVTLVPISTSIADTTLGCTDWLFWTASFCWKTVDVDGLLFTPSYSILEHN